MLFPDKDLNSILLLEYHLEDLTNTSLVPTSLLESHLQTACQLYEKSAGFSQGHGSTLISCLLPLFLPPFGSTSARMDPPLSPPSRHQIFGTPPVRLGELLLFYRCMYLYSLFSLGYLRNVPDYLSLPYLYLFLLMI